MQGLCVSGTTTGTQIGRRARPPFRGWLCCWVGCQLKHRHVKTLAYAALLVFDDSQQWYTPGAVGTASYCGSCVCTAPVVCLKLPAVPVCPCGSKFGGREYSHIPDLSKTRDRKTAGRFRNGPKRVPQKPGDRHISTYKSTVATHNAYKASIATIPPKNTDLCNPHSRSTAVSQQRARPMQPNKGAMRCVNHGPSPMRAIAGF